MAITEIKLKIIKTGDSPKIEFYSVDDFTLGTDFPSCFEERTFDSLNFESIGLTADGATVQITTTSGRTVEFIAMPVASMVGTDMAVTVIFDTLIDLGGGTQKEWNQQAHTLLETALNWK